MANFQTKKSKFGLILEGLAVEGVGAFYGHLVYFMVIWCIFPVLVCCAEKNLATLVHSGFLRPIISFSYLPRKHEALDELVYQ
jgi:hypothetical protein